MTKKKQVQVTEERLQEATRAVTIIRTVIVSVLDKLPLILVTEEGQVRPGMEPAVEHLRAHVRDPLNPTLDEVAGALEWKADDFSFASADEGLKNLDRKMKFAIAAGTGIAQFWFKRHRDFTEKLRKSREEFFLRMMANPQYPEAFEAYQIVRDKPKLTIFFSDYVLYKLGILSKLELDKEHKDRDAMEWRVITILDWLLDTTLSQVI